MAKKLSENQLRVLKLFQENYERMKEYGGWMMPRGGYQYPYDQRMDMNTVNSLLTLGLIESKEPGESMAVIYRITERGTDAIKEAGEGGASLGATEEGPPKV